MRLILILFLALTLPFSAAADLAPPDNPATEPDVQENAPAPAANGADEAATPEEMIEEMIEETGLQFLDAADVDVDEFLWLYRLIVVMADTPNDPAFIRQIRFLEERAEEFVARDVIVITDTDPAAQSALRLRVRPRGFVTAIIEKDGELSQRRPSPRTGREFMAVIDRFPLRRQEMLERSPSGRD